MITPTVVSFVPSLNGHLSTQFPPPQNKLTLSRTQGTLDTSLMILTPIRSSHSVVTQRQFCAKPITYLSTVLLMIRELAIIITILQD